MTHTCVSKLTIIVSDNGLSPGRRQAIIRTNAGILLIRPVRTNFSEILIEIHRFSFKKIHFKMSSEKWWPFCLGLGVLNILKEIRWEMIPFSLPLLLSPSWSVPPLGCPKRWHASSWVHRSSAACTLREQLRSRWIRAQHKGTPVDVRVPLGQTCQPQKRRIWHWASWGRRLIFGWWFLPAPTFARVNMQPSVLPRRKAEVKRIVGKFQMNL